jgi:hypothetical protein
MLGATHEAFAKEASMRIERHHLFGPEGKGQCQSCSQQFVLERNELDEWLCGKCRKVREAEIRRRRGLRQLRDWGISLPDNASEQQVKEMMTLHGDVARYVGDVWYHLTGSSYKSAVEVRESSTVEGMTISIGTTSPLPEFDRFVSSIFADRSLAVRLAAKERERTAYATARLSPEQQSDPYKYIHIVRGKPKLVEDGDYHFVVKRLYDRYGQFVQKKPWWKFW